MEPLMALATSKRIHHQDIFEKALSDLMLVLRTGQINCPIEQGLRGFHHQTNQESFKDLPIECQ
jgi:hypothetical protein